MSIVRLIDSCSDHFPTGIFVALYSPAFVSLEILKGERKKTTKINQIIVEIKHIVHMYAKLKEQTPAVGCYLNASTEQHVPLEMKGDVERTRETAAHAAIKTQNVGIKSTTIA